MGLSNKLKILFLTPRFPYPLLGGDRLKSYNLLAHLASKHDVHLVSFYQGSTKFPPQKDIDHLKQLGLNLHIIPLNPAIAGLRILFTSFLKFPLEIGYYYQPEFKKVVEQLIKDEKFDIGIAFFMRTAEYIKDKPFHRLLIAEDCRRLYQQRSYQKSTNLIQRIVRWWEHRLLKTYEPEIVNHFDTTTLVTDEDINAMKEYNSSANFRLLTNGVDVEYFKPSDIDLEKKHLLFTGKLDLWANHLMINTIIKDILPKIRKRFPGTKLLLVGANPSKSILTLQNDFIEIHANVPSLVPYLQKAACFIHPHQGGSGIQNKLLEAMSCAVPVVTSPTGIQGIQATHCKDIMIGTSPEEMVEHIIKLMTDRNFADHLGRNARQLIIDTHSWQSIFDDADSLINQIISKKNV
jgi:sugar transferase (PEP-CTERM/EpsH1 system associated)